MHSEWWRNDWSEWHRKVSWIRYSWVTVEISAWYSSISVSIGCLICPSQPAWKTILFR